MALNGLWWWIDRWRKSTAFTDMTLEQQGAYRNLLDEAHLRGGALPNDERILSKACGDATKWRRVRDAVLARFELREDGWHHPTLDDVMRESMRRAAKQKRYRQGKNSPTVKAIIERDGQVCGICVQPIVAEKAEIDHIIPVKHGGHVSDVRNMQLAHPPCNQKKGANGFRRHESLISLTQGLAQGNDRSNDQGNTRSNQHGVSNHQSPITNPPLKNAVCTAREDEPDELSLRAGRFCERYADLFREHRKGARYVGRPALDFQEAKLLVGTWDDGRLDTLVVAFLTTDDPFCRNGSGTIAQFRSRASWCDAKLREHGL